MARSIPPAPNTEYWSELDQGVHRKADDSGKDRWAHLTDPADYSTIGGPEHERAYGRTRNDPGTFPFRADGGASGRDPYGACGRGGYLRRTALDPRLPEESI